MSSLIRTKQIFPELVGTGLNSPKEWVGSEKLRKLHISFLVQELSALNGDSDFLKGEKYVAKYEFGGSTDIELQFKKGGIVTVIEKADNGWWKGICEGQVGWFPETYVRPIPEETKEQGPPPPAAVPPEEVSHDHDMHQPRGMDEMMASGECHVTTIHVKCLAYFLSNLH